MVGALPKIDRCITGTSDSYIEKLNVIQRKALRMITMSHYSAHCDPIYYKMGTLKFEHIIELEYIKSGHKLLNNMEPDPISKMFRFTKDTTTRSSGQSRMYVPKCRLDSMKGFTKYKIPVNWNKAIGISHIKLGGKIPSLVNSYKKWRLEEYSKFNCSIKNCYSCLMS